MANVGVQASVWREVLYTRLVRSLVRWVQMAKAAHKYGKLGNGNGVLHRALLGQVVKAVRNGHTCFCTACDFTCVTTSVMSR